MIILATKSKRGVEEGELGAFIDVSFKRKT